MQSEESFGEWLKRCRRQLGLTQQQLADCASCSIITIRKFESDERKPSLALIALLADCLNISAEERAAFQARARGTAVQKEESETGAARVPVPQPPNAVPLVGRSTELEQITVQLGTAECRLLSLIGTGGVGKTRLALAAAHDSHLEFLDGVVFVSLAAVQQPAYLPQAIANSLGIALNGAEPPAIQLGRYLHKRSLLLVLDNFEHLLEGGELLADLLERAPLLKCLVTTRERLHLVEEWLFPVQAFTSIGPGEELFTQAARRSDPHFSIDGHEAVISEICRLVGGLPLAIELAAGWIGVMTCEQIEAQIRQGFDFLSTSLRNVPQRHRSLRGLFDQSWQLLTGEEQAALQDLSVFQGGFLLPEAAAVAGASPLLLRTLFSKSLIFVNGSERYNLHEVIRQYGLDRLRASDQEAPARQRHLEAFLALANDAHPRLFGPDAVHWFGRLDAESANFRAALGWADQQGRFDDMLRLVNRLSWFWFRRGRWREAENWVAAALAKTSQTESIERCRALLMLTTLIALQGRMGEAVAYLTEAMQMARNLGDPELLVEALKIYGRAVPDVQAGLDAYQEAQALWQQAGGPEKPWVPAHVYAVHGDRLFESGQRAEAVSCYHKSLALYRKAGNVDLIAYPLGSLGMLALNDGQLEEANQRFAESIAISRAVGNRQGVADWLIFLGIVTLYQGNPALAQQYLQETLQLHDEMGNLRGRAEVQIGLALAALWQGNIPAARQSICESLLTYQGLRTQSRESDMVLSPVSQTIPPDVVVCIATAGLIAAAEGKDRQALAILAAAGQLGQTIGYAVDLPLRIRIQETTSALCEKLLPAEETESRNSLAHLSLDDILAYALTILPPT